MENRIRHFRKLRGLTLEELGRRVDTTAQTVSRIETQKMRLSTDWIEKFAAALEVQPTELIAAAEGTPALGVSGAIGADGVMTAEPATPLSLDVPAADPVAARIAVRVGDYSPGEIVIGQRVRRGDGWDGAEESALGRDCLVQTVDGRVRLARVIKAGGSSFTLVPVEAGGPVLYDRPLDWIARIVMRVRYV